MNRFIQNIVNNYNKQFDISISECRNYYIEQLKAEINTIQHYQWYYRQLFKEMQMNKLLPAYSAFFIDLNKQYLTIGVNGLLEAAEFLRLKAHPNNKDYKEFISLTLQTIAERNAEAQKIFSGKIRFNTELVPAENLGVKFAKWDKKDGYIVPRDCYNSYLYPVEDESLSVIDKLDLHGNDTLQYCDGGSACHLNIETYPSIETVHKILQVAIKTGCPYFCFNVKVTVCNECGHISKETRKYCDKCNSYNVDYATRVIGYLRRVTNFSKERQIEEFKRAYSKINE